MTPQERFAFLTGEARRRDPDRFRTVMLLPAVAREPVLALLVLDRELASVAEGLSQPMAGLIRCQWWRDGLAEAAEAAPRAHPVLEGLAPPLRDGRLSPARIEPLIELREQALDGERPADEAALERRLAQGGGALQELAARILGIVDGDELALARAAGTAYALASLLEAVARREPPALALVPAVPTPPDRVPPHLLERLESLIGAVRRQRPHPAGLVPALLLVRLAAMMAGRLRHADPNDTVKPPAAVTSLALVWASLSGRP